MIIILLLFYVRCGHIYSGPNKITYPLATKANQFQFTFALSTQLDADEYIKILFPFQLGSNIVANLQTYTQSTSATFGDWDLSQLGEKGTIEINDIGNATTPTIIDNIYYFGFSQVLLAQKWYIITIYATTLSVQTSGYKSPVKIWSVSSINSNAIIYDENPSFAQIALQALPSQTLNFTLQYSQAYVGLTQLVTINITPSISFGQNSTFLINIDTYYSFQNIDESTVCQIESQCSCIINSIQELQIDCNKDFINQTLTVVVNIKNSEILYTSTQSSSITVYSIVSQTAIEYNTLSSQLKLSKLTLTVNTLLLWGIKPDSSLITLYKPATSNIAPPFNNVKIQFQINSQTPSNEQLITITTGDADAILQGSISHNLGSQVICYWRDDLNQIYCKHVTSLQSNTTYFVAFKCAFLSTASSTQTNFGRVTIKNVIRTSSSNSYTTYILAGPTGSNLLVQESKEYIDSAAQGITNFGNNFVSYGDTSGTFTSAYTIGNMKTVGLQLGSQRLIFYINVPASQICPTSVSYCSSGQSPEIYMKVLFNKNNIQYDNTTITIEQSSTCSQCSTTLKQYNTDDVYLLMKCTKNYNVCTQLFNGGKGFGFVGNIQQYPSLYPGNNTLDFIVAFYYGSNGASESMTTLASVSLIQGYVIGTQTRTLKASFINYITAGLGAGTTSGQNKGEKIPTLIRVLGTISNTSTHVGIFVDGSIQTALIDSVQQNELNDDEDTTTTSKQFCSINNCIWYGHLGTGTTQTYSDLYTNQRMILLKDFSGSSQFDMIVGITNYGIKPESIVVASLTWNSDNNGFDIQYPERIFGAAWQISNMASGLSYYKSFGILFPNSIWDNSGNWNSLLVSNNVVANYKIADVSQILPGSSITLTIDTSHTDTSSIVSQNSNFLWGSGFLMSGATTFTQLTWTGGTCIATQNILFCPFDQNTYNENTGTLSGTFIVPSSWGTGTTMSDLNYAFSSSVGNMVAFKKEVQTTSQYNTKCTISDWVPIYPNTKIQEQQITFNLSLSYNLSLAEIFYLQMELSAIPGGLTIDSFCNYYNRADNISCQLSISSNTIKFKSTITGINETLGYYLLEGQLIVIFYVSHSGLDTDEQTCTGFISIKSDTLITEQCETDSSLEFQDSALSSSLILQDFSLDNYYSNSKSIMSLSFQINQRSNLQYSSIMLLQLGFISSTNSALISAQNNRCLFYDQSGTLTHHWSYMTYDSSNKQLIFELKQLYYSSTQIYQLKCTNICNPDSSNTDNLTLIWSYQDSSGSKYTTIQSNMISTPSLTTSKTFSNSIKLTKYLNCPGIGAFYQFLLTPTRTNMTSSGSIYIEFSTAQLVLQKQLYCSINSIEVHCTYINRRITIQPEQYSNVRMTPNQQYTIIIGPIIQPKSLDGYGKIWIASDLNSNSSDGFMEQTYISDLSIQTTLPSLLPYSSVSFSAFTSRTTKVYLKVNFTAPIKCVNIDKQIVIQLGDEFRIPFQRISSTQLECRLYRISDATKTNYTSTCTVSFGQLIIIKMLYDSTNSRSTIQYSLEIRSINSPDLVSLDTLQTLFPSQIQLYITDTALSTVSYISPPVVQYLQTPLIFTAISNQQQFQWYIYDVENKIYEKLIPIVGMTQYPTYTIYSDYFNSSVMLFLGLDSPSTQFQRQVNLSITQSIVNMFGSNQILLDITNYNTISQEFPQVIDSNSDDDTTKAKYQIDALLTSTMTIEIGDFGYYFYIAAKQNIGSGIYYLNFDRDITDKRSTKKETTGIDYSLTVDYYSLVPTIALIVDTTSNCQITTSIQGSNIPLLGYSQPIQFSTNCIPISEIYLQPVVTSQLNTPNPLVFGVKLNQAYNSGNPRFKLDNILELVSSGEGTVGDEITLSFSLSGVSSKHFQIDNITFYLITNTASDSLILNSSINTNSTSVTANCTKDGSLLWSISPSNLPSNTFSYGTKQYLSGQYNIDSNLYTYKLFHFVSPLNQYLQYYQQYSSTPVPSNIQALYSRELIYGIIGEKRLNYITGIQKNVNKIIKFTNVESNMQIQLACKNQYNTISDIQTYDLSNSSNIVLKNHSMLIFQFTREISSNQLNNLICSIKEYLLLNIHHVQDVNCQICNPNLLYYTKKSWTDVLGLSETFDSIINSNLTSSDSYVNYYFYLNNYLYSNTDSIEITTYLNNIINKLTTSTGGNGIEYLGKNITNTTTDPEISYLLKYVSIVNYTDGTHDSVQSQISISANMSETTIDITIQNSSKNTLVFLGIQKFTSQLDFSDPINLRRGLTGNGIQIEQSVLLQNGESSYTFSITPYDTTSFKYFLQWSSAPIYANCLSQQYQDTQLLVLEYDTPSNSYHYIITITIMIWINY